MSLETILASASCSVFEARPDATDPESQYIRLDGDGGGDAIRALVDVDHGVPPGQDAEVLSAILKLYKAESWSDAANLTAKLPDDPWDPYETTWNNQPDLRAGDETVAVAGAGAIGDEISIDVTDLVNASVAVDDADGSRFFGFLLEIDDAGPRRFFSTLGPEEYRPKLVIQSNIPPDPPDIIGPDGGLAVSKVRPELVLRPNDKDADDTVTGIHIQIADNDAMATPFYDSTAVDHDQSRFDLNDPPAGATATADLDAGPHYWWGKTRDAHGAWSDWSDIAEFVVVEREALTITYPNTDTVDSPVPTFTHTFDGQDQVEVDLEHQEDGVWYTHWEIPMHVSASLAHTVPDEYALEEGVRYRLSIRGMTEDEHVDMAGDRVFVEDSIEFELEPVSV